MDLKTIRQKIVDSSRDDWNKITCWGAGSGPVYRYGLTSESTDHGIQTEARGHACIAVLIDDVDISIAWGYDPDDTLWSDHRQQFDFSDFLPTFPAKDVSRMYADVFYGGALVDRELFVVADGGRYYVPIPRSEYPNQKSTTDFDEPEHHYTPWELGFARVVNGFEHAQPIDEVLSQIPHVVDEDRPIAAESK